MSPATGTGPAGATTGKHREHDGAPDMIDNVSDAQPPTVEPFGQWRDGRSDEPDEADDPADFRVAVNLMAAQLARLNTPAAPAAVPEKEPPRND